MEPTTLPAQSRVHNITAEGMHFTITDSSSPAYCFPPANITAGDAIALLPPFAFAGRH
jgi:hypothetical protein